MFEHWEPAQATVVAFKRLSANVLFDAKSRKVKLGDEYNGSSRQADKEKDERFQAMAEAPHGTPHAAAGDGDGDGDGDGSLMRISSEVSVRRIAP